MKKIRKIILTIAILIITLVAIDLLTKYVFYNLARGSDFSLLTQVFNTGVSRGMTLPLRVMYGISFIALGLFIWMYSSKQMSWFVLVLLLAGTLGNLIDRIVLGGVRDFISIGNFPVFNIADVFLNIGVFLFFLIEWKRTRSAKMKK